MIPRPVSRYRRHTRAKSASNKGASAYLKRKNLEFMRNYVLDADRNEVGIHLFKDFAKILKDVGEAEEVCAPAFKADGLDSHGLAPEGGKPCPYFGKKSVTPHSRGVRRAPSDEDEDVEDFFFDSDPRHPRKKECKQLCFDLDEGTATLFQDETRDVADVLAAIWSNTSDLDGFRESMADRIGRELSTLAASRRGDSTLRNIRQLAKFVKLSPLQIDILVFSYLVEEGECQWIDYLDTPPIHSNINKSIYLDFMASALDVSPSAIRAEVCEDSLLATYGFVDYDMEIDERVRGFIGGLFSRPIGDLFFHFYEGDVLPMEYFSKKIREETDQLCALIEAQGAHRGVNVLLHGVPGAGKTSLAHAVARRLGLQEVIVPIDAKAGNGGRSSKPEGRFGNIAICNRRFADPAKYLVVVDEADELLAYGSSNMLNNVLDRAKSTMFFITNLPAEELSRSTRRRFDFAMGFKPIGKAEREKIWCNNIKLHKLEGVFTDAEISDFAAKYAVSAGAISRCSENFKAMLDAGKAAEPFKTMAALLENHAKLMGLACGEDGDSTVSRGYILDGLNIKSSTGLESIIGACSKHLERLGGESDDDKADDGVDAPRMNILLSGPAGCGKTEFVKFLGEKLGRKVRALSVSDLVSKYVGETEANIRSAFECAEDMGEILFLDEVDSFLRSRGDARHSWEVTQVNEILQRMENFKGVLVCATNFTASLDQAVLRRFTFKVEFGYLTDEGKRLFFERSFKTALTEDEARELDKIKMLAPGDFRTVRQRLYYTGEAGNAVRLAALRDEASAKLKLAPVGDAETPRKAVGF